MDKFMTEALAEAKAAQAQGEIPIGAVIVKTALSSAADII